MAVPAGSSPLAVVAVNTILPAAHERDSRAPAKIADAINVNLARTADLGTIKLESFVPWR